MCILYIYICNYIYIYKHIYVTEKSSQKFKLYKQTDVNRFESLPPRGVGVLLYAITGTLVATKGAGQWGPKKCRKKREKLRSIHWMAEGQQEPFALICLYHLLRVKVNFTTTCIECDQLLTAATVSA